MFNCNKFFSDTIHNQFLKFNGEGSFKHHGVLVYLFLYYQSERFNFPLKKLDAKGKPLLVIH